MVKAGVNYLIGSSVVGLLGAVLVLVSLGTPNWITANCKNKDGEEMCNLNYGLFTGHLKRKVLAEEKTPYSLTIECLISENVCMWSCLGASQERHDQLEKLYNEGTASFGCGSTKTKTIIGFAEGFKKDPSKFNSAGLWITTIFFLALSAFFHFVAVGFNILNVISNPIETWAGVYGLYLWYGIAEVSTIMVLILHGAHFNTKISQNVAIYDTIIDDAYTTKGFANLAWSFWILIIVLICDIGSIALIYLRQYKLNKAVEANVIKMEEVQSDGNVFMY